MSSTKSKLRFLSALVALAALALAVSCTGFFPPAVIQTIALQPTTPSLAVGTSLQMEAWATDSNNNRYQLTSNVSWQLTNVSATSGGSVMTLSPAGLLTATSPGTATIQASSQGIAGTTTASVVNIVTSMIISPVTNSVLDNGSNVAKFKVTGNGNDITSQVTLTAYQNNNAVTGLPCSFNSTDGYQECQPATGLVPTGTQQVFTILVTYSGYTGTVPVTAILTVTGG